MQKHSLSISIPVEMTRTGRPAVWEHGGGFSNTGSAIIFTDQDGRPPRAIYIKRKGHLACSNHALIPLTNVMWAIEARHHRGDFDIQVCKINKVTLDRERQVVEGKVVYSFSEGEWVPHRPPEFLWEALMAAKKKATTYHCRNPVFVSQDSF